MKILIYETREDELEAIRKFYEIHGKNASWRLEAWQNLTFIIFLPGLSDTTILILNRQKSWGSTYAMPATPPMELQILPL